MSWITDLISGGDSGESKTLDALRVVEALRVGDHDQAVSLLAQWTGEDQKQVAAKAVELGADPNVIAEVMKIFGKGETIEVSSRYRPTTVGFRWSWVAAGLGGIALGMALRARIR